MKKRYLFGLLLLFIMWAFSPMKQDLFKVPFGWPQPVYNFSNNPLKASQVELGRALFYDPVLSRNNTISCVSCHSPYNAFAHNDHDLSHGIEDKIGTRNAPALMNLAWSTLFMWDGAINHLDVQSLAPISNPTEMDEKIENVVGKLQQSPLYTKLFYRAFGDSVITGEHTLKAIAQFMLTLQSCQSRYDSVMRHETSFTAQEQNGYRLFRQHCAACHTEPLFTNNGFENNGLPVDSTLKDIGRMKITRNPSDSLKFKVPTLRNIEFSSPYMHDGRFKRLSDVLKHYSDGIEHQPTLSEQFKTPIVLSSNEKVDLTAFLLTLTDKDFLFNPKYSYPKNIFSPNPKE